MNGGGHVVVNPHALGEQGVRSGDVNRYGAGRCVDADNRLDFLFVEVFVDQEVAGLDELGGREAPLRGSRRGGVAADHERVLGRRLQAAVDDHEAVVLAEADAGDAGGDGRRAAQAVMGKPVVLGAVRNVDFKTGHLDGRHAVAGLEVLDGREASVLETDKGTEEQAVAARTASARSTGPAWSPRTGTTGA